MTWELGPTFIIITTAYRYTNNSPHKTVIHSIFTLKFALPELTVLYRDGPVLKIPITEISGFMNDHLKSKEIDNDLYNAIKKDYPKLFFPPIDPTALNTLHRRIKQLIDQSMQGSAQINKPFLILLSELHGSKDLFFLHTLILRIAHDLEINHLLVETINVYHAQYGWDAHTNEIERLMSFAKDTLGMEVKDLEGVLHYKNILSPYPYHEIPEPIFGVEAREASWIIDTKALRENNIMIAGSGHLNSLVNSELKEIYSILPIDCSGDKEFSDILAISQHNFIPMTWSTNHLSLDEIIIMSEKCPEKN